MSKQGVNARESLGWSNPPFKVVRALSDIKLYQGPDAFEPEEGHNQEDYQTIHEFENYIDEDEEEEQHSQTRDSDQSTPETQGLQEVSLDKNSKVLNNQNAERIKLNGKWMIKERNWETDGQAGSCFQIQFKTGIQF